MMQIKKTILYVIATVLLASVVVRAEDPYQELLSYDYGKPVAPLFKIEEQIRAAAPSAYAPLEEKLLHVLLSKTTPYAGKKFVCEMLYRCGSAACVPALAALLTDEKLSHMARHALQGMPYPEADTALQEALGKVAHDLKIGVVSTIGARGNPESVSTLAPLVTEGDERLAKAALIALGRIGGVAAAKVLSGANVAESLQSTRDTAWLLCADSLCGSQPSEALAVYKLMFAGTNSMMRVAALRGIALSAGDEALPAVLAALNDQDGKVVTMAIQLLGELPGPQVVPAVVKVLATMKSPEQVLVVKMLEQRGERSAATAVAGLMTSPDAVLRHTAVLAMGLLGGPEHIAALLSVTGESSEVAAAARSALVRMSAPGVDKMLMACVDGAESVQAKLLISTLTARRTTAANPLLLRIASSQQDKSIRDEAVKALKTMGRMEDLPALVKLLQEGPAGEQDNLAQAIVTVGLRQSDETQRIEPVLAALQATPPLALKAVLLRIAGGIGGAKALAVIQAAMDDPDENVHDAAVRALVGWPDDSVAEELLKVARDGKNRKHRILALQAYIRLAAFAVENRRVADAMNILRAAGTLCQRPEDKRYLLGVVSGLRSVPVMELAATYLNDPEVTDEAAAALVDIAKAFGRKNPQDVTRAMELVLAVSKDEALCKEARKYIRKEVKETK